jgi:hypothetical protein
LVPAVPCCPSVCPGFLAVSTKAILAAFDKYQVVGMGAAHGFKDLDDYILSLIRNPAFPDNVNDIVVECGNCLYQDILDRYIAGEDVPLAKMQLVWRNTTQIMCSLSGFYAQLFPLVRQINRELAASCLDFYHKPVKTAR